MLSIFFNVDLLKNDTHRVSNAGHAPTTSFHADLIKPHNKGNPLHIGGVITKLSLLNMIRLSKRAHRGCQIR